MSHTIYTGKSATTTVAHGAITITGWRKITIEEKGKPLATPIDITDAGDSAYTFIDDPLGGKGANSCSCTVEGFLSVTDHQDTGLTTVAVGTAANLLVTTKELGDLWTVTNAIFRTINTGVEVATVVPYTYTFELQNSAGTWSTDT